MKTLNFSIYVLVCFLFSTTFAKSQIDIFGKVIDYYTKIPIEGVLINYVWDNKMISINVKSNKDGSYEIIDYPHDQDIIELIFRKEGYEPKLILVRIVDKKVPNVTLIPTVKTIRGRISNFSDNDLSAPLLDIAYSDGTQLEPKTIKVGENGTYSIKTKKRSGEKIDFYVSPLPDFPRLEYSQIIPESGNFDDIFIYRPKKRKWLTLLFGIGSAVFTAGAIIANENSKSAYKDYLSCNDSNNRDSFYKKSNNWNKTSIISASLAGGSAIGLGFTIGDKRAKQKIPKVFTYHN